jgi:hypothetical protein
VPGRVITGYNWGYLTDVEMAFRALTAPVLLPDWGTNGVYWDNIWIYIYIHIYII